MLICLMGRRLQCVNMELTRVGTLFDYESTVIGQAYSYTSTKETQGQVQAYPGNSIQVI